MHVALRRSSGLLQHAFSSLQRLALLQGVAFFGLTPLLLHTTPRGAAGLTVLGLSGVYLLRKALLYLQAGARLRQLSLETQVVRSEIDPCVVLDCLRRDDHLWRGSLALKGLRFALNDAGRTGPDAGRLADHFARSLSVLRAPARNRDLYLLGLLAVVWVLAAHAGALLQHPLLCLYHLLIVAVLVASEALHGAVLVRSGRLFGRLVQYVTAWALDVAGRSAARRPYRHVRLYQARPASRRPAPLAAAA